MKEPWTGWREASCMPDRCFCEAAQAGAVRQPANTVSSGAFLIVALLVVHRSRDAAAWRFAAATLLVGVGSAFFHASLTFWGQTADVLGMYLVATFLLLESLSRRRTWTAARQNTLYLVVNVALLALLVGLPALRRYAFGALVLAIVWSEWTNRRRGVLTAPLRLFATAIGVLAFGFGVWILDITHLLCAPTSLWQGHALWHVCGAVSAWLAYRYMGDELGTQNSELSTRYSVLGTR
ncbi:MAG: ceramidase domain-containing protein [Gemmatimonadaceae bacterium]|nr:ceramidase domain-containing protein [Gemmatimonadaceae bacterium]